ncbi:hypothetical protein [uncultured Clostridium sp.]|uniref:hypothetical protein n=1 Tax=uncultured Clostridium sp. TaxID=59620 RepID=UPI0025E6D649|nr:hypothetical protein [uncultured Clostridium sp.]
MENLSTVFEQVLKNEGLSEYDRKTLELGQELGLLEVMEIENPDGSIEKTVGVNLQRGNEPSVIGEDAEINDDRNELVELFIKRKSEEIDCLIPEPTNLSEVRYQMFARTKNINATLHVYNGSTRVGGIYSKETFILAGTYQEVYVSNGGMKYGMVGSGQDLSGNSITYSAYPYGSYVISGSSRKAYRCEKALNIFDGNQKYVAYVPAGGYVYATYDTVSPGSTRKDWMRICAYKTSSSASIKSLGGDNYYADAGLLKSATFPAILPNY